MPITLIPGKKDGELVYVAQMTTPFAMHDETRQEKDVAHGAGFWWGGKDYPYWYTTDPRKAKLLIEYARPELAELLALAADAPPVKPRQPKRLSVVMRGHEFVATSPTRDQIKRLEEIGFSKRYNLQAKADEWYATDVYYAVQPYIWNALDEPAKIIVAAEDQKALRRLEMSRAHNGNYHVPFAQNGHSFEPYPFQKDAVAYCMDLLLEEGYSAIGDQTGLGKSLEAILVMNKLNEVIGRDNLKNVLIICPPRVKLGWRDEIKKWSTCDHLLTVIVDANGWPDVSRFFGSGYGRIVIIHPHIVHKYKAKLDSIEWDFVVLDEWHKFINKANRWSKVIMGGHVPEKIDKRGKRTPEKHLKPIPMRRKLAMTYTPIRNRTPELFTLLNFFDPLTWDNFEAYKRRYYKKVWSEELQKYEYQTESMLAELNERVRRWGLIRRETAEVRPDLPTLTKQIVELEIPEFNKIEERMLDEMGMSRSEYVSYKLKEPTKSNDDLSGRVDGVVVQGRSMLERAGIEQKARREASIAVVPIAIDFLKDGILEDHPVLYFFHHRTHGEMLKEQFGSSAELLYGGLKDEESQRIVDRAWKDPTLRLLLMSTTIAEGINLQCYWHCIFGEPDYSPGVMDQAAGRILRIGQTSERVLAQYFLPHGSVLSEIMQKQLDKAKVITEALDARGVTV